MAPHINVSVSFTGAILTYCQLKIWTVELKKLSQTCVVAWIMVSVFVEQFQEGKSHSLTTSQILLTILKELEKKITFQTK